MPNEGGPLSLLACSPQHTLKACLPYFSAQSATPHNIFYTQCLSRLSLLSAHTASAQLSKLHCVIKISKPWDFHYFIYYFLSSLECSSSSINLYLPCPPPYYMPMCIEYYSMTLQGMSTTLLLPHIARFLGCLCVC